VIYDRSVVFSGYSGFLHVIELLLDINVPYEYNSLKHRRVIEFNATFNNISVISWWLVLLVEETRIPGENHRPVASHLQTLSHKVVVPMPWF
jgi:hypothetical protein